jgi:hypothetical protein
MEARRVVIEDSSGTITDRRLVGAYVDKWAPLLEGMGERNRYERYLKGCMAMLYENQARHLRGMNEETRAINVGYFTKFIFPVLSRVFPNLIANEIVSVQPMTAPQGAVFYLDYVYGTSKGPTTRGDVFPAPNFDRDYTSEYVNGEILATGDGVNYGPAANPLSATYAFTPVHKPSLDRGFDVIIREINAATGATVQEGKFLANGNFDPATSFSAGTLNYSNGAMAGARFLAIPANGNQIKVYYRYDGELNTKLPELQLDVKKAVIQAESRRLKALWSSEAAEDLRNLQGLEAETELVSAAASEMALEIDREIIQDLFLSSTGTTDTFDRIPPAGIAEVDHLRSMITVLSKVSNAIHKKTLRAPANWIVTSPEISALMEQLTTHGDYRPIWVSGGESPYGPADMPRPLTQHGQFGVYKAGTLMRKWVVYVDPFFTYDFALVGLKGGSYLDAGFVWAPYVPLQVTPTFLDPNDMSFRKGLRTRYAKKLLRPEYYGQVRVLNL